jgi:hypothetical protein
MTFNWRQPLFREDGELDSELMQEYMSHIVQPFLEAPQAIHFEKTHDTAGWPIQFAMHSIYSLKRPLHRIEPQHQEKILLHSFPQGLICYPDVASDMIEELRLMWLYFAGEYSWDHAMACHDALEDSYIDRVNYALTDPDNFCESKKLMLFSDVEDSPVPLSGDFITMYVKKSDAGTRKWACQDSDNVIPQAMQVVASEQTPAKKRSLKERKKLLKQKLRRPR